MEVRPGALEERRPPNLHATPATCESHIRFLANMRTIILILRTYGFLLTDGFYTRLTKFDPYACPQLCTCFGSSVLCLNNGRNLKYIPLIPILSENLYFQGNYLPFVDQSTFKRIDFLRIYNLDLSNNSILTISQNAFSKLTYLTALNVAKNKELRSEIVTKALLGLNTTRIYFLGVSNMGWNQISSDFFKYLDLPYFTHLNLIRNNLEKLEFSTISSLKSLALANNILIVVPNFCKDDKNGYFPKLEYMSIGDNLIYDVKKDAFMCLEKLKELDISSNPIHVVQNGLLLPLKSLEKLSMYNFDRHFKTDIEYKGLMSNTLKQFQFSGTFVVENFKADNIFDFSPNLQIVEFQDTYLTGDLKNYKRLFSLLKNLEELHIRTCGLSEMPTEFFTMFPKLKIIDLVGNKISSWNGKNVFGNMTTIKSLNLLHNVISIVNESSFTKELLSGLEKLDFGDNQLACVCDNLWFRNWIRTTKVFLGQYPEWYVCYTPPEMRKQNTTFDKYNPTTEDCTSENILVPTVTGVTLSVIFLIGLLPLIYKCRWHIRYRIYLIKQSQYQKISNDEEFVYWGFVIYSDDDRDWVHRELIHHLEEKEGLPLCIRLRDFDVGRVIVDNIVENMNCSKKIILVLSNNFANSDWCRFEYLLAQDRVVSEGLESLVLIMLEEINSNNLSRDLHALITTTSYAAWATEEPALQLFWKQVITAVKCHVNSETQCMP